MDNAGQMQRMFELVNKGDVNGFIDNLADDFVEHEAAPGLPPTKEGTRQLFETFMAAFPNLRFDPEDMIESGDKVVARIRVTGTQKGDFFGVPPSGKSINVQGIDIVRFGDGLAREHWGVMDTMLIMQQLGAIPQGPPA